jgi:hypothetical protein
MTRFYSDVSKAERIGPAELPGAIGITAAPGEPMPIGIAYEAGHVGGWRGEDYLGKREATWRLVVRKVEVDGRFVLRSGEFVELADGME